MKVLILRDKLPQNGSLDAIDNLVESQFAERYLKIRHKVDFLEFTGDITSDMEAIRKAAPDIVFNLVETVSGSGALSSMATQVLDLLHIPYTGCPTYAQYVTGDKGLCKTILENAGISTPSTRFIPGTLYILKERTEHASAGLDQSCILSFESTAQLHRELERRTAETGCQWIAEQYVEGREFSSAFLADRVLPSVEYVFDPGFTGRKIITYEAKWNEETPSYRLHHKSFDLPEDLSFRLQNVLSQCCDALKLKGYARCDTRMDSLGNIFVIDVNTNPCISPDSTFIAMVEKAGLSMEELFEKLIQDAHIS